MARPPRPLNPDLSPRDFFGAELRRLRLEAELNQRELAEQVHYSTGLVAAIEKAQRWPQPDFTRAVDDALQTGGALTRLLALVEAQRTAEQSSLEPLVVDVTQPQAARGQPAPGRPIPAVHYNPLQVGLMEVDFDDLAQAVMMWAGSGRRGMTRREALSRLSTALALAAVGPLGSEVDNDAAQRIQQVVNDPHRVDVATLAHTENIILSCRRQGDVLGPEIALQTVSAQRQLTSAILAEASTSLRARALSVHAELSQLAGWSLFNLGRYDDAQYYYEEARALAHEAENTELVTYVLCAMSQLATWRGMPRVGIDHAAAAATWAESPYARAYAADVALQAYITAGNRERCREALDKEQQALGTFNDDSPSAPWWYFYTEAFCLQTEALYALRFNEPDRAHQALDRALEVIDSTNLHNVAFSLLDRGDAYIQQGELVEASSALGDVARLSCSRSSRRILQRLQALRHALSPWEASRPVRELDDQLRHLLKS